MLTLLREIPYLVLVPLALLMAFAPFTPEPHLVEKTRMLLHGQLHRPLDIFDLILHAAPALLLVAKFLAETLKSS